MIRFICVVVFLILFLILTIPVFFIEWLIGKFNRNARDYSCLRIVQWGFKAILKVTGVHTTVIGFENIPDEPVLFIGNHRSFFDILLTYSRCPRLTGYVAKKEMEKIPLLSTWMRFVYCLFLDRENPKEGLKTILQAIDYVKQGISICIFPEGTRNKGEELSMLPFKEGAFKIAAKTGCAIVPISMNNTAAIFENQFPRIKKVNVVVEYGTPIYPKDLAPEDKKHIGAYVQNIIQETINKNAELIYLPINANGVSSIIYDIMCLIICLFKRPDVVLILGVSGCLFLPIYKLFSKSKIIVNIDGLEWRRNKWGTFAKKFLKISEAISIRIADIIISDNQAIADYVENKYKKKSVVIAYGGDHATNLSTPIDNDQKKEGYYLGLCRIEPENNIEMILNAFINTDKKIKFMGNWDNSEYGRQLKKYYSNYPNITLLEPNYNIEELYKLRKNCLAYIHGHSAGGTNPSLVEAMHFNIPIFAFDCDFNRYTTNNLAHYFNDSEQLSLLAESLSFGNLKCRVLDLKNYAEDMYNWRHIAAMYESIY